MNGAREYANLFRTGQYGRLFIVSSEHARGKEFHIWILPEGVIVKDLYFLHKDVVEVYGVLGGQLGWTEWYGWIHHGKWEKDFQELVVQRRKEISQEQLKKEKQALSNKEKENLRILDLLSKY